MEPYRRHRFPPTLIQHAIWMYLRFTLSYRDVEEVLAQRGLDISYETVRRWVRGSAAAHAAAAGGRGRPEPAPGLKREVSSDGQVGHQDLSLRLRAQQHRDKEDGQPDHRGDEDRARKGDVVGGCV